MYCTDTMRHLSVCSGLDSVRKHIMLRCSLLNYVTFCEVPKTGMPDTLKSPA